MDKPIGIKIKPTLDPRVALFSAPGKRGKDNWVEISRGEAMMILERHLFALPYSS